MNGKLWERIIDLVKKKGERVIVIDAQGEQAFVVMSLDEYERPVPIPEELPVDASQEEERFYLESIE